jgi:hypothetical protein
MEDEQLDQQGNHYACSLKALNEKSRGKNTHHIMPFSNARFE